MKLSAEKSDQQLWDREGGVEPLKPIDRNALSKDALLLLDRYRIDNANDPKTAFVLIVDQMHATQREVISRFEAAIALAGVEFGRIDLAIEKAEETQGQVKALATALDQIEKDFALTTNKIRQRSNSDIILNHLKPFIYGLFGVILTLLVVYVKLHLKVL